MSELATRLRAFALRFHRPLAIGLQALIVIASNAFAFLLRFDGHPPVWAVATFWQMLPWLVGVRALTFIPFRLYEGLWRYTSIYDLQALIGGVGVSSAVFYLLAHTPLGPVVYPRSIYIIDASLLVLMLGGVRMARRVFAEFVRTGTGKRMLVFGAGDAAERIVRDMKASRDHSYQPIGFIDDNVTKLGRRIHGVPVLGTRQDVPRIMGEHRPDEVLIAVPSADAAALRSIVRMFEPFEIPIKTLPNVRDIVDGNVKVGQIRSLSLEDLLARAPVGLDPVPVRQLIAGRRVMVTGAGGSIGSELCRQIARLKPAALIMFERYENSLHQIRMELHDQTPSYGLHAIVGDITDPGRLGEVLREHRPHIIFHAAAHKHVPLMEENPCEAIKNNVRGTRLLAEAADMYGVHRFILISTDKAVNPTSVMGASKRLAELVVEAQAHGSGTAFSVVRFGNVLGSNGSVVPRFMEQIRRGGPVTITHPEMRRFFMLIPEAVQLVLHAASHAQSNATYMLDMGEQVKLVDMVRDMIRLSGLALDDIRIEFVGLRPGEKLSEELIGPDEEADPSGVEKVFCVRSRKRAPADFFARIDALEVSAALGDRQKVLDGMKALVGMTVSVAPAEDETVVPPVPAAAVTLYASASPVCPKCATGRLVRSRTRTLPDRIRKQFTAQRPFRCDTCEWRGWLPPPRVGHQPAIETPATPDLSGLDYAAAAVAPHSGDYRGRFSPRDLS